MPNDTNAIATTDGTAIVEEVVTKGDLSSLSADQKAKYYIQICESLGLNPYTQPFGIYSLNGKQVMYAKKDAAEQLRRRHKVSIVGIERDRLDDILLVTVTARTPDDREDSDIGAVNIGNLKGEALANAIMKAITKGKRRVTLSLCGLGMLDETEVETIPEARPYEVNVETGEIIEAEQRARPTPRALASGDAGDRAKPLAKTRADAARTLWGMARDTFGWTAEDLDRIAADYYGKAMKQLDTAEIEDLTNILVVTTPEQRAQLLADARAKQGDAA